MTAALGISIFLVISVINSAREQASVLKLVGARDRIWSSIQTMALMPASLRNSSRALASDGFQAQNPQLRVCLNGDIPNSCRNGVESGLSLYSPVVFLDAAGAPVGLQRITAAAGGADIVRYDMNGLPCQVDNVGCFFIVTSTFVPTCGPAPLPAVMPANPLAPNIFAPVANCTVADIVEVRFTVSVDQNPALINFHPYLSSISPKSGTAISSVKMATGNDPQ